MDRFQLLEDCLNVSLPTIAVGKTVVREAGGKEGNKETGNGGKRLG